MTDALVTSDSPAPEAPASTVDFNAYLSALPPEGQELFKKNGVDSFDKQVKWVSNLNSAIGKKGLIKPDEKAGDDEKKAYRDALLKEMGRPDDGKYEFELPDGSNEQYYTDDFLNGLALVAYENGMSKEGFQKLLGAIATPFNQVVGEWEKKLSEIKAKIGEEDKLDDGVNNNKVVQTKEQIHEEARQKLIEANELFRKGNYAAANRLKTEANELYNRMSA